MSPDTIPNAKNWAEHCKKIRHEELCIMTHQMSWEHTCQDTQSTTTTTTTTTITTKTTTTTTTMKTTTMTTTTITTAQQFTGPICQTSYEKRRPRIIKHVVNSFDVQATTFITTDLVNFILYFCLEAPDATWSGDNLVWAHDWGNFILHRKKEREREWKPLRMDWRGSIASKGIDCSAQTARDGTEERPHFSFSVSFVHRLYRWAHTHKVCPLSVDLSLCIRTRRAKLSRGFDQRSVGISDRLVVRLYSRRRLHPRTLKKAGCCQSVRKLL